MIDEFAFSRQSILRLQQTGGNAVVGRLLRQKAGEITVHEGSRWSAGQFADKLTKNRKVPKSVGQHIRSKKDSLVLSGDVRPAKGTIGVYTGGLNTAFKAHQSEITTAKSTIKVTKGPGGRLKWKQVVSPDLAPGERLGHYLKTGPSRTSFLPDSGFSSDEPEVIYGWTPGKFATNRRRVALILIMVVTEIEVINPSGKKKVFKPNADNISEAILHEISIHAARQSEGKPDIHDTSAVIRDVVDEIGGFFRPRTSKDELEPSETTKDIMTFIHAHPAGHL